MFVKDIGIDLGTSNILVYLEGSGIVINEPSIIAIDTKTRAVIAVGEAAKLMEGRTPSNISTYRPLKSGAITDLDMMEKLISALLAKVPMIKKRKIKRVLICCPTNNTNIEFKTIQDIGAKLARNDVIVERESKVAAIGAGLDISQSAGNMMIDIGGGTTDIAILSLGDIVSSVSLKIGGTDFDNDVLNYIKKKRNLIIGQQTAERVKIEVGTVYLGIKNDTIKITGRDIVSGLPRSTEITSQDVYMACKEKVGYILQAIKSVLEITPPELSADLIEHGIILTGGGAYMPGLRELLTEELQLPIHRAEFPLECVIKGTELLLNNAYIISNK
ncbi:rod shape-determining protein [Kurthia sibirica]|uniref:Cell shape-determining protein MreB n=1 Tax=Kurthia sibirica TaxID=202750 RepID=A0A2U3AL02_9BACL|nr:rod shape-determining protein [Kurthia sibirica]PWI25191.1 rod shape-determining protein [Kurthia sibirica]GEK33278.1 rod shape-determining protein [Kurthia sibirica]